MDNLRHDFTLAFLSVLFEGIPFLLLGSLISGLIEAFVPAAWMTRLMPRNSIGAVFVAGLAGIFFPMCECGVTPVIRRLLGKGLPVACALTYMLASPIVNPIVALSTVAAFKGNDPALMTSARIIMGYLIAVVAGAVFLKFSAEQLLNKKVLDQMRPRRKNTFGLGMSADTNGGAEEVATGNPMLLKCGIAVRGAATDFLDTMIYFVIGASLAAMFSTAIPHSIINPLASNEVTGTLALMFLAFVISICSTSDAFVAATLTSFSMTSKLAFLVFGPMMDIKLLFLYSTVLKKKVVVLLAIGLFITIAIASVAFGSAAFGQRLL